MRVSITGQPLQLFYLTNYTVNIAFFDVQEFNRFESHIYSFVGFGSQNDNLGSPISINQYQFLAWVQNLLKF